MKIKRYVVREMQEAIQLIKQDLGPEALIVSSYKVLAKGFLGFFSPRMLEVTAVLDDDPENELSPAKLSGGTRNLVNSSSVQARGLLDGKNVNQAGDGMYLTDDRRKEALTRQSYLSKAPAAESLYREDMGNLRETSSLFDMVVSKQMEAGLFKNPSLRWRQTLLDMDVQENVAEHLMSFLGKENLDTNYQDLYINLYKRITHLLEPAYRFKEYPRVLTFIGPAGVGKTTTLAKLATRFSLYEHKKIALITIYTYRVGSVEQLNAYGDFLGIPVEVVMTPSELAKALESHRDKDYIFIDTAGRSACNTGQLLELKGFLDTVNERQDIFLVLSLTTKNRDLNRIASEFRRIGYSKLIFTKLDETETHGAILNLICALGLPAAYLTNGQVIPDDISEAGPKKIAKLLLRGVDLDEIMAI